MGVVVTVGLLFGMILGQFFKCYILVPAYGLAVVVVLASRAHMDNSLLDSLLQFVVLTTSLQIGYLVGLAAGNSHRLRNRSKNFDVPGLDARLARDVETRERSRKAASIF